jgi:hypothetical protein
VQLALVLAGVDSAEFVGAGGIDVEVGSEGLLFQLVGDALEECLLGTGLNCVDFTESKAEQTVVVFVRDERAGDGSGDLDGLPGCSDTSNVDLIEPNSARGTAAIAIRDVPSCTLVFLPGFALARVESRVVATLARRESSAEDPPIRS